MGNLGLFVLTVRPMVASIRLYAVEGKKDTEAPHGEAGNMLFFTATILPVSNTLFIVLHLAVKHLQGNS